MTGLSTPPALRPAPAAVKSGYVLDVSRPEVPWRWTDTVLAPLELLAVVWTVPVAFLLLMLPLGVAIAALIWVAQAILDRV